jgi:hypothetical protein
MQHESCDFIDACLAHVCTCPAAVPPRLPDNLHASQHLSLAIQDSGDLYNHLRGFGEQVRNTCGACMGVRTSTSACLAGQGSAAGLMGLLLCQVGLVNMRHWYAALGLILVERAVPEAHPVIW